jgi:hypothetical protein
MDGRIILKWVLKSRLRNSGPDTMAQNSVHWGGGVLCNELSISKISGEFLDHRPSFLKNNCAV